MRTPSFIFVIVILATTATQAQTRETQSSNTTENLRGVSAVSAQVVWASGSHGTYIRTTDGGRTWTPAQVPDASTVDFRGVVAFSADEAFLMSAGPGDQSRIYHTTDAGQHWQLQFTNTNPKGFFDSIAFWDRTHGVVLGDPVPDEKGQLKFELLMTEDGQTWTPIPAAQLPPAIEGEGAFAASDTCLAILPSSTEGGLHERERLAGDKDREGNNKNREGHDLSRADDASEKDRASAPEVRNIWFATGGRAARVFHSPDGGKTWQVFNTPINHGPDSAGIFSITFRDPLHGVIAGGDYKKPDQDGPNLAFTKDGGQTWEVSKIYPQSYYSAIAYDRKYRSPKSETLNEDQAHVRLFIANPKFIFDFRPPRNPTRISPPKKAGIEFNAVSPYPEGGAIFVGPKGSVATVP